MDYAACIMDAAQCASSHGESCSEMTILIAHDGGIRMFADSDWGLDSLAAHHGARAAYRVTSNHRSIGVASLAPVTPAQAARVLFG